MLFPVQHTVDYRVVLKGIPHLTCGILPWFVDVVTLWLLPQV